MIDYNSLKTEEYLEELKLESQDIIEGDDYVEAFRLSNELLRLLKNNQELKSNYFEFYKHYISMIIKLRWVALPLLKETEVVSLFLHHFIKMYYVEDYNIFNKLKASLLAIVGLENRDKQKQQIINALLKNQEKVSIKKIVINQVEKEPTVANWLQYYNTEVGDIKVDRLKRAQFLSNNANFVGLKEDEKNNLKVLFKLYEHLRLSSQDLEGFEEDIPIDDEGREGYIRGGVFEPISKLTERQKTVWQIAQETARERMTNESTTKNNNQLKSNPDLTNLQSLAQTYPAGSLERKTIEEEIRKLEQNK